LEQHLGLLRRTEMFRIIFLFKKEWNRWPPDVHF